MTKTLEGRTLARQILSDIANEISANTQGLTLGIILVGEVESSRIYVNRKVVVGERLGIKVKVAHFTSSSAELEILKQINDWNNDPKVTGILVQLPLPGHFNQRRILDAVNVDKDVDGLSSLNMGRLITGQEGVMPATPQAVIKLLKHYKVGLKGKRALIIGRSLLVGKPLVELFLRENATVTVAHRYSHDLTDLLHEADIAVVATGVPGLITKEMIQPNLTVVDVGISRSAEGIVGDVSKEAKSHLRALSPVPGGIGPLTIACLFVNLWYCHTRQVKKLSSSG